MKLKLSTVDKLVSSLSSFVVPSVVHW